MLLILPSAIERNRPPAPGDKREEHGCHEDGLSRAEGEIRDKVENAGEGKRDRRGASRFPLLTMDSLSPARNLMR